MKKPTKPITRRRFLGKAAQVSAAALAVAPLGLAATPGRAHAEALPRITEDDPVAVQFGYLHDATKVDVEKFPKKAEEGGASQSCANCSLYQPEDEGEWGGCTVIPGKAVKATGWCSLWMAKLG